MSAVTLDTNKVLSALLNDKSFLQQVPEGEPRRALEVIVTKLPEIMADQLNLPATLATILAAKIAFLKFMCETELGQDFICVCIENSPNVHDLVGAGMAIQMLSGTMGELAGELAETMADLPKQLAEAGLTEETLFLSGPPDWRFSPEVATLYQGGQLTVAALLEKQPSIILKNS